MRIFSVGLGISFSLKSVIATLHASPVFRMSCMSRQNANGPNKSLPLKHSLGFLGVARGNASFRLERDHVVFLGKIALRKISRFLFVRLASHLSPPTGSL